MFFAKLRVPVTLSLLIPLLFFMGACTTRDVVVQLPAYEPQYCYKTLAEVECHESPLEGEDSRRLDWYEPPTGTLGIKKTVRCVNVIIATNCPDTL